MKEHKSDPINPTPGPWRLDIGSVQPEFFNGKLHEAVYADDECIAVCGENQDNARLISYTHELWEFLGLIAEGKLTHSAAQARAQRLKERIENITKV